MSSNYSSSICTICSTDYKLSSLKNKCMMPIKQCGSYIENLSTSYASKCLVCNDGYLLSTLKNKCMIKVFNCLYYD